MDLKQLDKWMEDIKVRNMENSDVEVINHSPLKMLGKGRQGAVFKVSDDICVKVFGNIEDCKNEYYALTLGQNSDLFPRLYIKGPNYIAMELIKGVDLREYLQSQALTPQLSAKLIEMLITFKAIGFKRIDHHKRQIFLQADGKLKVIDVGKSICSNRFYPYPRRLLTSIGEKNKKLFLSHVQEMAPPLYDEWTHYIRMEELSRHIYQLLIKQSNNTDTCKTLTNSSLLTTKDEEAYVHKLKDLVRIVFEEEWIKTMLARGLNPNEVMDKIKADMESLERKYEKHRNLNKEETVISKEDCKRDKYWSRDRRRNRDRHHGKERKRR